MKNYLVLFMMLLAATGFAQSKVKYKDYKDIHRLTLKEYNLTMFYNNLAADCKDYKCELVGLVASKVTTVHSDGFALSEEAKNLIKNADLNSYIHIHITGHCAKDFHKEGKFKFVD